jgi:hypothetical protein
MCDLRAVAPHRPRDCRQRTATAGRLEADTLSYLGLDEGLPQIPRIDSYVRILDDKATRRRIIRVCKPSEPRATRQCDLASIKAAGQVVRGYRLNILSAVRIADLPGANCGSTEIEFSATELPKGGVVGLTGDSGSGKHPRYGMRVTLRFRYCSLIARIRSP